MDREAFIAAMIIQLQEEESLEYKAEPKDATVATVCKRLQKFDFPEVSEQEMDALCEAIGNITSSPDVLVENLRINEKFLENLDYLSTHNRSPFVFRCLRTLFLQLPLYFQSCSLSNLRRFFDCDDDDYIGFADVFSRYTTYCMMMSTSMLTLRPDDMDTENGVVPSEKDIKDLISLFSSLSVALARPSSTGDRTAEEAATLQEYMRGVGHAAPQLPSENDRDKGSAIDCQAIAVDLYFHVGYLIRDLLLLDPAAIPACMPVLYDAIGVHSRCDALCLADAEQSIALLILGSIANSCMVDRIGKGKSSHGDGAVSLFLGEFITERIGTILGVCRHFIPSVRADSAEACTEDTESSRQQHVYFILSTIGTVLVTRELAVHEVDISADTEKSYFEEVFESSQLLNMLQDAAVLQFKRKGTIDTRLSRLLSLIMLRYGENALPSVLRREEGKPSLISMLIGDSSGGELGSFTFAVGSSEVSHRFLQAFAAYSVSFLLGLIFGLVETISSEDCLREWVMATGDVDSLVGLHKLLSLLVSVFSTCVQTGGSCLGAEVLRRVSVAEASEMSVLIAPGFAGMLQDLNAIFVKEDSTPRWLSSVVDDKKAESDAPAEDAVKEAKNIVTKKVQKWISSLISSSSIQVIQQSDFTVDMSQHEKPSLLSGLSRAAANDDDSDWEWVDKAETDEATPAANSLSSEPTSTDLATVATESEVTEAEATSDEEAVPEVKPAAALISQVSFNTVRTSLKRLKCSIDDIVNDSWVSSVVKKID